ncbi:MAG: hypothetical protein JWP13_885 [Candidatus Saccharibacteria bacterium]|nr:hypothetical protein [Candidatus Saccharibacteria bacterium]
MSSLTTWWFVGILGVLLAVTLLLIFVAMHSGSKRKGHRSKESPKDAQTLVDQEVEHIFNDAFREELRNRGRLHFEKIIGENAMFLQQDLRLTTSQLNEYMKTEITRKLKEEFTKYEESIMDAKQLAVDSIQKTNTAIDEQRAILGTQLQAQVAEEKKYLVDKFETDMTRVVNHYILESIGNQIDLSDQLGYIIGELEANKKEIIKDISNG